MVLELLQVMSNLVRVSLAVRFVAKCELVLADKFRCYFLHNRQVGTDNLRYNVARPSNDLDLEFDPHGPTLGAKYDGPPARMLTCMTG